MKYKAIPTDYKGIKMRSGLEVTWAIFFDKMGWKWKYEPFALPGWIPDFVLYPENPDCPKILVEVKPFDTAQEWKTEIKTIRKALQQSGVFKEAEVLLLGSDVDYSDAWPDAKGWPRLGWLFAWGASPKNAGIEFDEALFLCDYGDRTQTGFFCPIGYFLNRITGEYEGDHHLYGSNSKENNDFFFTTWYAAKESTRWVPKIALPKGKRVNLKNANI